MAQPIGLRQQQAGLVEQGGTDFGDLHRPLGTVEQPRTELQLEVLDVLGEGWLRDVEPFGGAAEMQFLGDGNEAAERSQVHFDTIKQLV